MQQCAHSDASFFVVITLSGMPAESGPPLEELCQIGLPNRRVQATDVELEAATKTMCGMLSAERLVRILLEAWWTCQQHRKPCILGIVFRATTD